MLLLNRFITYILFSFLCIIHTIHTGAGILPYAWHRKTKAYHFLLGKEAYGKGTKDTWSDFGGRMDPVDNNSYSNNAIREFYEESGYPKKSINRLRIQLANNPRIKHPYYRYFMYFAQIPYRPAETLKGDGEKSEFAWIPVNSLIKFLGREFYQTNTIPGAFIYNEKTYTLRKDFQKCLNELFKQYDPKKEQYYFRAKNPKKIIERIMNIK